MAHFLTISNPASRQGSIFYAGVSAAWRNPPGVRRSIPKILPAVPTDSQARAFIEIGQLGLPYSRRGSIGDGSQASIRLEAKDA